MGKRALIAVTALVSYWLFPADIAGAASFSVSTSDGYPPAPPATWNPRAQDGLFTVVSEETDYYYTVTYSGGGGKPIVETLRGTAAAAAYGSDTSAGDGILDPRLEGYAIQPMADTRATSIRACTYDGGPYACNLHHETWASASASVNHRIVQRAAAPPDVQVILDGLQYVPVHVDYALSATATNPSPPYASLASAGFSIMDGSIALFSRKTCSSAATQSDCTSVGEESGTWVYALERSTAARIVPYAIIAGAGVFVDGRMTGSAEAQAVADPYLYVDPAWVYAPYFMVEQESLLQTGRWIEVTNVWTQPIPESGSWAMLLAGLAALAAVVRRRS